MKQIVQSLRDGTLRVIDTPAPSVGPTEVLVATRRSVISSGTERAVRKLASASLLAKARARPELVRQVIAKARVDGVQSTLSSVRNRLDDQMTLGYSAAGTVVAVGGSVDGVRPGDRVATAGVGHGELQLVPMGLCAKVPDGVADDEAAFATIASIALHGLRLAELGPGACVCVIGLGLLGQLAVRLAVASGYRAFGIDIRPDLVERARAAGAEAAVESGSATTALVKAWSRGRGADAVLMTAATASSEPMRRAPAVLRDRGRIVVVGDVGLELERTPLYEHEISVVVARSYGPGRYDRSYEDWGVDYPIGHVRWTVARNLEAVLDLLATGRLSVDDLVSHRYDIGDAEQAYASLSSGTGALAVQLTYGRSVDELMAPTRFTISARRTGVGGVGMIGAGLYAKVTLLPAMKEAGFDRLATVASKTGLSARLLAEKAGFERVAPSVDALLGDPDVDTVFVASSHDSHASLVTDALKAGKHVFCEKPLTLTEPELDEVIAGWAAAPGQLVVGFNRRYSPAIATIRELVAGSARPPVMVVRVNAGRLGESHWYNDRTQGGRLLGEASHFVDTCGAIAASPVKSVQVIALSDRELLLTDNFVITISYESGAMATIVYTTEGHASTPKESIEVLVDGHTAFVDDFRAVTVDGKTTKYAKQDKGHVAELRAFRRLVRFGEDGTATTASAFETMRTCFAAVESLLTGRPVSPRRDVVEQRL